MQELQAHGLHALLGAIASHHWAQKNAGSRAEAVSLESPSLLPQGRCPCHERRAATAKLTALILDTLCSAPLPPISGLHSWGIRIEAHAPGLWAEALAQDSRTLLQRAPSPTQLLHTHCFGCLAEVDSLG